MATGEDMHARATFLCTPEPRFSVAHSTLKISTLASA